jgi:hypothetical protein
LIIALAFLALFGLWVSATLASAENSLHIAQTMKVEPKRLYAADGGVEQIIQKIRYDQPKGVEGDTSCGGETTMNGKTYFVQCKPSDGSGVSPNSGSSPNLGILAFSDGAGYVDGVPREFGFTQRKNGTIKVDGGLFSNAGVSFQNGSACPGTNCQQLNLCPNNAKKGVTGALFAAPRTVTVPSFLLAPPTAPYDKFVNTATESDVGAPIAGAGIPTGTKITAVVGPSSVTTSANVSTGANKQISFREDYPPTNALCHPWDPTSTHGDVRVMGSDCPDTWMVKVTFTCNISPTSTDPTQVLLRSQNPTDPHYPPDATTFTDRVVPACPAGRILEFLPGRYTDLAGLNNLTNGATCAGKIFYFKPGTYYFDFTVPSGVEPIWYLNNPKSWLIAGQRTWDARGSDGSGIFFGTVSKDSVTLDLKSGPSFVSTDSNKYLLGGLDMPVGAQVSYSNANKLTIKPPQKAPTVNVGGNSDPAMFALTTGSGQDAGCDKGNVAGNHPGAEFIFGGNSRLTVGDMRVEICAPAAGNEQQIAIYGVPDNNPYIPPGTLKKQTGCLKTQPYPANGCPFLYAAPTLNPVLLIHGTVYAPDAVVDLTIKNLTYQVVSRGLLARVVALEMYPNAVFTDPVIFSPNFGQVFGADREMLLTACENGSATSCAKPKLRALVSIQDHDELNFSSVGYKVNVQSWTIVR